MAVRIRLKKMGRAHRPFYRVCAFDGHAPRDGRALEELGTYDTSLSNTDARAVLNGERIDYWLSVGAQPTEKVAVLIKKYGKDGTHLEHQKVALEELVAPKSIPDPGAPASLPTKPEEEKPAEAEAAPVEAAGTEAAEAPVETAAAEPAAAEPAAETPAAETPADEAAVTPAGTPAATPAGTPDGTPAAEEEAPKAEA